MLNFIGKIKQAKNQQSSQSDGPVKYSCNFSNKNYTNEQFKKEITAHSVELNLAVLVDCSYNKIDTLILKNYREVETLKANNNLIKRAELNLSKLKYLDLSFNKLREVPTLSSLHSLEIVLLDDNLITAVKVKQFENISNISALELSRNKIRFECVEDFSTWVDFLSENFPHLDKILIVDNPFTYEENFKEKYFSYIAHKIIPLKKLNGKLLVNLAKNKGLPGALLGEMLEKEKKSKNPSANFEKIVLQFEKFQLDRTELEAKYPKVEEKLYEYTKEILEEHFEDGDEYVNDDKDTLVFDNLINLFNLAIEETSKFNEKLVKLFIIFSSVRKGKWAKQCFNFLKHICNSDEALQPLVEKQILLHYSELFNKLSTITIDTKINSGGSLKGKGKLIEDVIDQMPLIVRGVTHFINSKFAKLVKMFYTNLMYLFENGFYSQSRLEVMLDYLSNSKGNEQKREQYERQIKLNFFKYTIKVLYLSTRSKCIHLILDDIKQVHVEKIFEITMTFYDRMIAEEGSQGKTFFRMFNKIIQKLFTICRKLMANPNFILGTENKTLTIVKAAVDIARKKYKILPKLKDYLNKYYMNGEFKMYTVTKVLLPRQELQEKIHGNKILGLLFKLFLHITSLFPDEILKNLNNIIGLVMNTYSFTEQSINDGKIRMEFDPVMVTLGNYVMVRLLRNYKIFWKGDLNAFKSFFLNVKGKLEFILQFINDQSEMYRNACRIAYIYAYGELGTDLNCISAIALNGNIFISKLASSQLNFLAYFGWQGKYEPSEDIKRMFGKFNAGLNEAGRDNYLIDCLKVPNERIKTKILSCFLTVKYDEIATEELGGLLRTISNANWLEGRMERIIADTFYFVMKLFHENFLNATALPFENSYVIEIALRIIEKNTSRTSFRRDDIDNIRMLNISCVMLLINISGYQNYVNVLDKGIYAELIKNAILNEYSAVNPKKKIESALRSQVLFPLDIEKCYTMWRIDNLKNICSGQNGLQPYNYVSLRIIIHMANVLMNIPYKTFDIYKDEVFNPQEVKDEIYQNESYRTKVEKENFKNFKKEIKAKFAPVYELYATQSIFYRMNEIIFINSNYLEQHFKFVENFRFFLEWLTGDSSQGMGKSELSQVFNKYKYDPTLANPDKLAYFKKETNAVTEMIKILNGENEEGVRDLEDFTKFVLRANNEKKNNQGGVSANYTHIKNDLNTMDKYGETPELIERDASNETVDNLDMRCLFIAAFLRCIYAVFRGKPIFQFGSGDNKYKNISYKNTPKMKLINILRTSEFFQKLVILVDTSKLSSCNLSSKFLTVLNIIFDNLSLDYDAESGSDTIEKLIMLTAMVISKILVIFNTKGSGDDYSLINALVKCCLTICKELNFITIHPKTKLDLIYKIMSKNLVNVLIHTTVELMNKQDEQLNDLTYKKRVEYQIINDRIGRLLGEYMALCQENAYYIMEVFFKKLIIDEKLVRKTFIQDVMEIHKCTKMKFYVAESDAPKEKPKGNSKSDSEDKLIFASECLLFDCSQRKIFKVFFFLTKKFLYFHEYNENFILKNFDFSEIVLSNVQPEYKLDLALVNKFYFTSLPHRIFISYKDRGFSVLFKNTLRVVLLFNCLNNIKDALFQMDVTCAVFLNETDNFLPEGNDANAGNDFEKKNVNDSVDNKLTQMTKRLKTAADFQKSFVKNFNDKKKKEEDDNNASRLINEEPANVAVNKSAVMDKTALNASKMDVKKTKGNNLETLNKSALNATKLEVNKTQIKENNNENLNKSKKKEDNSGGGSNTSFTSAAVLIKKKIMNEFVFLTSLESKKLCDCFSLENRYLTNPKVLVFSNIPNEIKPPEDEEEPALTPTLSIYTEKYDDIVKLEVNDDYLKKDKSVWYKSTYTLDFTYNLNQLENSTFELPNIINATIKGACLKLIFPDDYSFFNVRSILMTLSKAKTVEE